MFKKLKKKFAKTIQEKSSEPFSLSPNPMLQQGKLGFIIAFPLLACLAILLYVAQTYYITQEEFLLYSVLGLVGWLCFLATFYSVSISRANQYMLFDREFGFTERLHPRFEIYCKPEDVRELMKPEDKLEKWEVFEERLKEFGIDQNLVTKIKKFFNEDFNKHLYYFRHKDSFEGWDSDKHQLNIFNSHMVFCDEPFDKQFCFGAGQENWYGAMLFNHPHAESDNVKVITWALDPFTNNALPICVLVHGSVVYKTNKKVSDEDIELTEAQGIIIARQHGMIESLRRLVSHLTVLKDEKIHDVKNIISFGHDIAKVDSELGEEIMRPLKGKGLWAKGWFKAVVSIFTIVGIVCVVYIVLTWLDITTIFG